MQISAKELSNVKMTFYRYFKTVLSSLVPLYNRQLTHFALIQRANGEGDQLHSFRFWQQRYHAYMYKDSWATRLDKEMPCQREIGKQVDFLNVKTWQRGVTHKSCGQLSQPATAKIKTAKFTPMQIVLL